MKRTKEIKVRMSREEFERLNARNDYAPAMSTSILPLAFDTLGCLK